MRFQITLCSQLNWTFSHSEHLNIRKVNNLLPVLLYLIIALLHANVLMGRGWSALKVIIILSNYIQGKSMAKW